MEERDALLFSLLQTRKLAVIGLDWRLEPAEEGRDARRILRAVEEVWWDLPWRTSCWTSSPPSPQG